MHSISFELLLLIFFAVSIVTLFLKNLQMPESYYKNREILDSALKDKISQDANYFNISLPEEKDDVT